MKQLLTTLLLFWSINIFAQQSYYKKVKCGKI